MTSSTIPGAYIDLHVVQTLPLSGLNLDGDGNPKSVIMGGVQRARISPQAVKRPVRQRVEQVLPSEAAVRTRRLIHQVRDLLTGQGWDECIATFAAKDVFAAASGGMKVGAEEAVEGEDKTKDPLATAALVFTPATTAQRLADAATKYRDAYEAAAPADDAAKPKTAGKAKGKKSGPKTIADAGPLKDLLAEANGTIALLGRTLMEIEGAERDACVQVASAFTTHEAVVEVDFFVAVDDYAAITQGVPDVGQMGDSQQTNGTFYRYATISLNSLLEGVKGDVDLARRLCDAFVDGFVNTLPKTGQTNSAAWTLPDLVHIAVRSDRPVNLSTAFDAPVRPGRGGHVQPSLETLADYAGRIEKVTAGRGRIKAVHAHTGTKTLTGLGDQVDTYDDAARAALDAAFGTAAR